MRVGILTTSYPRYRGDYRGVFIEKLADHVRRAGWSVTIIEPRGYDRLKSGAGLVPNLRRSFVAKLQFPFYCLHFLLIAMLRAPRCDILHANWSLSGLFAVVAGALFGKPVIMTERSGMLLTTQSGTFLRFSGWVMARCRRVVTISESARVRLEPKFPRVRFGVIPNGVDAEQFVRRSDDALRSKLGMEAGRLNILTVGRIMRAKRLDVLLAAVEALSSRGREVHAWIIGDGDMRGALEARVEQSDLLRSCVTFVGRKTQDEVADWMGCSDVLVSCSESETGGNVLFEALSSGLAVVATPVGWALDYIRDGDNGIIAPIGDVPALERCLERLLDDATELERLRKAARETIVREKLTWPGCAERYIHEYKQLAG